MDLVAFILRSNTHFKYSCGGAGRDVGYSRRRPWRRPQRRTGRHQPTAMSMPFGAVLDP